MWSLDGILVETLQALSALFVVFLGLGVLAVIVMFIADVSQTADAVRRNYPVVGRFRSLFTQLGEFFRQYFFAMDREEMPFNRAERDWVYRSASGKDNTVAFGSTRSLLPIHTPVFVNCPFPTLETEALKSPEITFGPYARQPYETDALINVSGMSYGAISKPAVQALSKGAKRAGVWMNTGEGGLSPFHLEGGADIVFQIGTAKYGVRDAEGGLSDAKLAEIAAHPQVRMFEIKMSQGAKPGKGGILPAAKISKEIAEIRGIEPHTDSVSPNRHPEIDSVGDMLDFIARVRHTTGKPTGFKCVLGAYGWLDQMCEEVHRRGVESAPDFITLDGGDGGTGAAPMPLMDNVGLPLRQSLPLLANILLRHGLKDRIRIVASGKLITPADVAWAYCVGADMVTTARGFMFSIGCIQAMKCNKNTCPTGITTHDKRLQRGLDPADKSVKAANFVSKINAGVGIIAHSCGVPHPRALKRYHVRIVQQNGLATALDELHPYPKSEAPVPMPIELPKVQPGPAHDRTTAAE